MATKYKYSFIAGFFTQDDPNRIHNEQIVPAFGLKDHTSPTRWKDFAERIRVLREERKGERILVFFIARHGQGWHNVAEAKYGSADWARYWAHKDGNGEIVWGPDPELSPTGISEAENMQKAWTKELAAGLPTPARWFASPFQRSCRTLNITFDGTPTPPPLIVEELREQITTDTCNKRSPKRTIHERFPDFAIEEVFTEEDELWSPGHWETEEEMVARARKGLDKIIAVIGDDDVYISITAHCGIARALMKAVGQKGYNLPTGGLHPMVVSARALP